MNRAIRDLRGMAVKHSDIELAHATEDTFTLQREESPDDLVRGPVEHTTRVG